MSVLTEDELGRVQVLLDHLGYDLEPSVLIGGWATQIRVGGDVSRDIDLIITDPSLRMKLREVLPDYSENAIHSGGVKGRGSKDGVHVDAYIPYESRLGSRLRLKVEVLLKYADPAPVRGWLLLSVDAHLATKFAAILDRPESEKGEKDAREINSLLAAGASAAKTVQVLRDATDQHPQDLPDQIGQAFQHVSELSGVNKKRRRELQVLCREWVDEAAHQLRGL